MIRKIFRYFRLKNVEVLVYRSGATSEKVTFEPYGMIRCVKGYRETEYKILDGKEIVHTSTVFAFSPTLKHLQCSGLLIGNCFTSPYYRGQSVYSRMLQYIVQKHASPNQAYFVFVHPENKASVAGIEKAGFQKVLRFKAKKRMHFFYNEEITRFSSETNAPHLHL